MARCMKSEKQGHFVFYGAMVSEGIIALVSYEQGLWPRLPRTARGHFK